MSSRLIRGTIRKIIEVFQKIEDVKQSNRARRKGGAELGVKKGHASRFTNQGC